MLENLIFIGIIVFTVSVLMLGIIGALLIFSSDFREVFIKDWNRE